MSARKSSQPPSSHPRGGSFFWRCPPSHPWLKLAVLGGILLGVVGMYLADGDCLFLTLTGQPCPSCGMTRAFLYLLRGDLTASLRSHCLLLTIPVLGLYFLYDGRLFRHRLVNVGVLAGILLAFILRWIWVLVG